MSEFDKKAASWDNDPIRQERSAAVAEGIRKNVPVTGKMRALEFGAGTGMTSFLLRDYLGEITLMDSSREMLKVADEKIRSTDSVNIHTLFHDLASEHYTLSRFDLVFSQMVLHHITDTADIISKFHDLLNPGGYLAIVDLYPEDGSFHGEGFSGHKGFNPVELSALLERSGFENTKHLKCYTISKKTKDSGDLPFDLFLLVAQRKNDQSP